MEWRAAGLHPLYSEVVLYCVSIVRADDVGNNLSAEVEVDASLFDSSVLDATKPQQANVSVADVIITHLDVLQAQNRTAMRAAHFSGSLAILCSRAANSLGNASWTDY